MYKELVVNRYLMSLQIDPNNVTEVNKVKKSKEFENGLLIAIRDIEVMNHDQAAAILERASEIYGQAVQQVMTNRETAIQEREVRTTRRNEIYQRRINDMRSNSQIGRLDFGAGPQYNYSPTKRRQRPRAHPDHPQTPEPDTPPPDQ